MVLRVRLKWLQQDKGHPSYLNRKRITEIGRRKEQAGSFLYIHLQLADEK